MGKLWKEFRVKVILTILVVSQKCHHSTLVLLRNEEERYKEGGSCV